MKRLENETFEDYKTRRKSTQKTIKNKLRGKWFFKSKYNIPFGGLLSKSENGLTYKRPVAETKTSFTENLRNEKGYGKHLKQKYNLTS